MDDLDLTLATRRGSGAAGAVLADEEKRQHCVSVRMNPAELARLDTMRKPYAMQRGEYLRCAAFSAFPPVVPEVNRQLWAELARLGANLNQLARHMNSTGSVLDLAAVATEIDALRNALIGHYPAEGVEDEG